MTTKEELSERYEMISRLGRGSEGFVYLCKDKITEELVAMKKIEIGTIQEVEKNQKQIDKFMLLKHEKILRHYDYFIKSQTFNNETFSHLCIVMELCNGGNLKQFINKFDQTEKEVTKWIKEISEGLSYLHALNIVHRDIKPENILLRTKVDLMNQSNFEFTKEKIDTLEIKLADFGIIRELGTKLASTRIGTTLYMAPEVISSYGYDTSADIWSFGIIILELIHAIGLKKKEISSDALLDIQSLLFKDHNSNAKTRYMLYNQYKTKLGKNNFKLYTLLFECLQFYPEQRPTASEILKYLDPSSKDIYIRNNPEKLSYSNFDSPTIPLVTETKILHTFDNEEAKQFWRKYIGENILEVVWRSFSGAYQTFVGRLGVTKARGLKKLLCGDTDVVTVYQFIEAVDQSGFPFPQNLLEKIVSYFLFISKEKYTDINAPINIKKFTIEKDDIPKMKEKYLTMILQYDNFCRDIVYNTTIDIEKECVPPLLLMLESEKKEEEIPQDNDNIEEDEVLISPRIPEKQNVGINAFEFIEKNQDPYRLFIQGDPSSGKTLLARMIILKIAKIAQKFEDLPIPIYVNVSLLTENFDDEFPFELQCIRAGSSYKYSTDIENYLLFMYSEKKVLLLIDGLDESNSRFTSKWLEDKLIELDKDWKGSNGGIIVTSRVLPKKGFISFKSCKILPLTLDQKLEIVKRRGINSEDFVECIKDIKFEPLTTTPLYLSMFIELFKKHQKPPDSRAQLYNKAIDDMIFMHVRKLRRNSGQGSMLNIDKYMSDLVQMMTQIAVFMHTRRTIFFSDSDIDKRFLELYPQWTETKPLIEEGQLSFFVVDQKRYKFSHLSFQEYFTSTKWSEKIKEEITGKLQKRNSIANLFSLGMTSNSNTPFMDVLCNDFILDPWFTDTFCFTATQLSQSDFLQFVTHFVNQKRSISSLSVIFDMMKERGTKEKENLLYKSILQQINVKKEKRKMQILSMGLIHPNKYIRTMAEEMQNDFQLDYEYVIKFLFQAIKSFQGDGESIGIAFKNLLKRNSSNQVKIIIELLNLLYKTTSQNHLLYLLRILENIPLEGKSEEITRQRTLIMDFMTKIMNQHTDKKIILQAGVVLINFIDSKNHHRDTAEIILKRIFYRTSEEILEIAHSKYKYQRNKLLEVFKELIEGDEAAYILKCLVRIKSEEYNLSHMVLSYIADKDDSKVINSLIEILSAKDSSRNSLLMALEALYGFNPSPEKKESVCHKLLELFSSQPWIVRDKSCDCIIKFSKKGDQKSLDLIYNLLSSDNIKLRVKLIKMLGKIADKDNQEAVSIIFKYLDDQKFDVRTECIISLSQILSKYDSKIMDKIFDMVNTDENTTVVSTIISVLPDICQRGDKKLIEILNNFLTHSDANVRINACHSLSKSALLGDEQIISKLFELLETETEHINIRAVAANSITELCTKSEIKTKVISKFLKLFKSDKQNQIHIGHDAFFGTKWSLNYLGATSENDVIFTQIYRLMRSELSKETRILQKEQIDMISKIDCLESNFILLLMNKEKKL